MSQHVSIWGVFPDQIAAGNALAQLESDGFGQSQIAIEKRFNQALAGFEWSQAIYVRLPEGIVAGFAAGGFLAAFLCCILAKGVPPVLPAAVLISLGCGVGSILGAVVGMIVARTEMRKPSPVDDDKISIGVLCFDPHSEDLAKVAFEKAGAAVIDTQA